MSKPSSHNSSAHKPSQWKVVFASGVLTVAVLALVGSILARSVLGGIVARFWGGTEDAASKSVPELSVIESLQKEGGVIVNEAKLLSPAACPEKSHQTFEQLKQQGIDYHRAADYRLAEAMFEAALKLCAAPETLIAYNNAKIGDQLAYTLVFSVPFSGSNANNAIEMLRGAAQAQDEVNTAGGINGVPLKLIVIDDGDQEERARALAIALADEPDYEKVLGVVGHWTSDVSLKAAAVYHNRKAIPFITPISTTKELTGFSPWVYRATINNRNGAQTMARHMLDSWQLKKAAIFYVAGVTYSEEIRKEFKTTIEAEKDGKVVAEFDMTDADFVASRAIGSAIDAGAEAILLATNNGSVDQALEVIEANAGQMKMLGDLANLYTPRTLTEVGESSQGLVMAVAWDIDGNADKDFKKTSQALWRGPVNYVSAMSYEALQAMIAAMEKAPDQKPTRASIQAALSDDSFRVQGASKMPLRFDRGDRQAPVQLIEVVNLSENLDLKPQLDFQPVGE